MNNHPFRTDYTPHGFKKEHKLQPLFDLLGVIAVATLIVWALGGLGIWLDEHPSAALQDAQKAAAADFNKELAAAAVCRAEHPNSLVRWNADGELVCTPKE